LYGKGRQNPRRSSPVDADVRMNFLGRHEWQREERQDCEYVGDYV
jgi:hypothetical protein